MDADRTDLTCPSAQPDMEEARIIGVISGSPEDPRIAYLPPGVAIDPDVAAQAAPLEPTQVFRYAAKCETHRCCHFDGARCTLAGRIVAGLAEVVDVLPPCSIRATCRWFAQESGAACRRCPQVVTMIPKGDDALNRAAMAQRA